MAAQTRALVVSRRGGLHLRELSDDSDFFVAKMHTASPGAKQNQRPGEGAEGGDDICDILQY